MRRFLRLLQLLRSDRAALVTRAQIRIRLWWLALRNLTGRRAVTGSGDAVVCLTSYGHRVASCHYTIESIARGSTRPSRLILWLDDEAALAHPSRALQRLMGRGLEVLPCPNFGPHNKQYPFALLEDTSGHPLVTADDDVLYPRFWLARLIEANHAFPDAVNCYRAHTIVTDGGVLAPYRTWVPRRGTKPSFAAFATGVSGVIYPPDLIAALRGEGDAFLASAPLADDVWTHAVAVRHGFRARQIQDEQLEFPAVPGTQRGTLYHRNVAQGGNDGQIAAAYRPGDVVAIVTDRS